MTKIEVRAKQAYELSEEGYSVDEIARAMGQTSLAIERWIRQWSRMTDTSNDLQSLHAHLDRVTVNRLRMAGITSREELLDAWENGKIEPGKPRGIGVAAIAQIQSLLSMIYAGIQPVPTKPLIVELSIEAQYALKYIKQLKGKDASQVINQLLIEAKEKKQKSD